MDNNKNTNYSLIFNEIIDLKYIILDLQFVKDIFKNKNIM